MKTEQSNIINIQGLSKSFGTNKVLENLNLSVERNSNTILLGKSGSGKSILIKCIVKLIDKDAGKIVVLGDDIDECSFHEFKKLRVRIGFLFQNSALYDSLSVRENLEFPLIRFNRNINKADLNIKVEETLESVGLKDSVNKMPAELSGGMRKRIGLARTLIMNPEIMLYDEPTTGLDPVSSREISELILEMQSVHKTTSLIITHDIKCAEIIADKVLVLKDGAINAEGSFNEISQSKEPWLRSYFK